MKTMAEIIQEHQRKAGAILSGYQDRIQKLTDKRMLDDPFAERLSAEEHPGSYKKRSKKRQALRTPRPSMPTEKR